MTPERKKSQWVFTSTDCSSYLAFNLFNTPSETQNNRPPYVSLSPWCMTFWTASFHRFAVILGRFLQLISRDTDQVEPSYIKL